MRSDQQRGRAPGPVTSPLDAILGQAEQAEEPVRSWLLALRQEGERASGPAPAPTGKEGGGE